MRPLLLALLALSTLAPRAQTAEHVRLADAVVEAADVAAMMQTMMGPMAQGLPGDLDQLLSLDALEDSLRARLVADGRTDALREVLAFLESPANDTLTARGETLFERLSDPAEMMAFQMQVAEQDESALADEALVRRYQRAQGTSEWMPEMMTRMFEAIAETAPEFGAMMKAEGAVSEMFDDENLREFTEGQVAAMRVALYGVPEEVLVEAIGFAESDAGRYYTEVGVAVTTDVMIPAMVAFMAPMFAGLPPASHAEGLEVFDVAEVQPELVGGIEALASAIVYPEDARAEGVEGRVIVQFVVDLEGAVTKPVVVRSPDERLSRAALAAVLAQRFTPGKVRGEPVQVRFSLPVTFRLTDDEGGD